MSLLKKRVLSLALAALVILGLLWYTRPRPLRGLVPAEDITCMSLAVSRLTTDMAGKPRDTHQKNLLPGEAAFDAVLSDLQGLRFRRTLLRDLLHQLDSLGGTSSRAKEIHDGDYDVYLSVHTGENYDCVLQLRYRIDEWTMNAYSGQTLRRSHVVSLSGGGEAVTVLFDRWWDLLPAGEEAVS